MRVVVAILLLLLPVAAGEPVQVLDDPEGDVQLRAEGQAQALPQDLYSDIDLVGLEVEEEVEAFRFQTKVAGIPGEGDPDGEGGVIAVRFQHHDQEFLLEMQRFAVIGDFSAAMLNTRPVGGDEWDFAWYAEQVEIDRGAGTYTVSVPRQALADSNGAPPFAGRALEAFRAQSRSLLSGSGLVYLEGEPLARSPVHVEDFMPASGAGDVAVDVRMGPEQSGHVRLASQEPRRASNGEASTFVFWAEAHNMDDEEDVLVLAATDAPSGWGIVFPHPVLAMGAGERVMFPVVVSTPFAHQHGSAATFLVEAVSQRDPRPSAGSNWGSRSWRSRNRQGTMTRSTSIPARPVSPAPRPTASSATYAPS